METVIRYTLEWGGEDGVGNPVDAEDITLHWMNYGNDCFINAAVFEKWTRDDDTWDISRCIDRCYATATLED